MKSKGWDHLDHARFFCDSIASGTGEIGSALIFTHGAGSLIVANALSNNMCRFSSATRWYTAMAHWGGSVFADQALSLCSRYDSMKDLLDVLGTCAGRHHDKLENGVKSLQSTYLASRNSELRQVAATSVSGAMCGHDAYGLDTGLGSALAQVATVLTFPSDVHDAFQTTATCQAFKPSASWDKYSKTATYANFHMCVSAVWVGCGNVAS